MQEKRRHPRFSVEGIQGTMVQASFVEIVNMSIGGVALRADIRLNIGREYTLKLDVEGRVVQTKGTVVWSVLSGRRKGPSGEDVTQYSAGLRFRDVLTGTLADLVTFIDDNKLINEHRMSGLRFRIDAPDKALIDALHAYKVQIISLSGMLIEINQPLDLEGLFPMEILTPQGEAVKFVGRIASCLEVSDEGPPHYEVGVEFIEMSPNDRSRLDAYVVSLGAPS
jgi:hypothetical protein